ncbi:unnamed protein product [Peniophora sp. CBMAI 1063]|nr:unnamed protein product [Peniophora sp. CBMAI 1063]
MAGGNLRPTNQQPTLSRFFAQSPTKTKAGPSTTAAKRKAPTSTSRRDSSPIDLTLSSDEASTPPAAKKRKTAPTHAHVNRHLFLPDGTPTPEPEAEAAPHHSGTAPNSPVHDRWKYAASQPAVDRTASELLEKQQRRARLAKALIADNNSFHRPRAEAASSDTERHGEEGEESDYGDGDDKFRELQAAFALKPAKGGARRKAVQQPTVKGRKGKEKEVGPSGLAYTPLELQVKRLKEEHPDLLLMILIGYKYKFYGEDAKIAAQHLGIVAYPDRNFTCASIPDHRRDIHLKKLLSQGYKIGIVEQTETAALKKASETRNEVFDRQLTHVYTAATYVDALDSVDDANKSAPLLMCLAEHSLGGMGADEIVGVGMIVVCPSTGDVVWDYFKDGHMRTELETRMVHVKPNELYIPEQSLSKPTQRMLKYFVGHATTEHKIRVEYFKKSLPHSDAFDRVSSFYTDKSKSSASAASESFASGKLMEAIAGLPNLVTIALAHCIDYLSTFNIADSLTATKFFTQFTTKEHMLLNGNTVTNLEIFQNETDFTKHGSLMWILDKTLTKFGSRLLHSWVGKPLVNIELLKERTDAIEEAMEGTSQRLFMLRDALRKLPDLAKGLCRIQYGKCTPPELATLLEAFDKVSRLIGPADDTTTRNPNQPKSPLWRSILSSLPRLSEPLKEILDAVKLNEAAEGSKIEMWRDTERYPDIADADVGMRGVEIELEEELKSIRKILKYPSLKWTTVNGDEYLIEYPKDRDQTRIPSSYLLHSSTKKARRYYTPKIKSKLHERARYAEQRQAAADRAFLSFLEEIAGRHYAVLRDAVNKLAVADCLFALATVAHNQDYVRPEFVSASPSSSSSSSSESTELEIVDGRHPMVEELLAAPFIPNSICLGGDEAPNCTIITGPNMGGKSSTVRMVALLCVMAQVGSYVPAKRMRMGMLDGVLTRMGASDELARGRSTFMVEMSETSDILRTATPRSLVILDELGRGTSTFDGMALAHAVTSHLISATRCKTLFITHYPSVATSLASQYPLEVRNAHMGFREERRGDGSRDVAFLYRVEEGLAGESFGIECARLAGLGDGVVEVAREWAGRMRGVVEARKRRNRARQALKQIVECLDESTTGSKRAALGQLSSLISGMAL